MWHEAVAARFPRVRLEILTTDVDPAMLRRAREATYERSSLRDLPMPWRERGFLRRGGRYVLRVPAPRDRPSPRASWAGPGRSIRPRAVPQPGFTSFGCERHHYVVGRAGHAGRPPRRSLGTTRRPRRGAPRGTAPGGRRAGRPCRGEGRPGTGPRRAAAPSGHARGARRSRGARDTASRSSVTRQPRLPSSNSSATSSSRRTRPSPQRLASSRGESRAPPWRRAPLQSPTAPRPSPCRPHGRQRGKRVQSRRGVARDRPATRTLRSGRRDHTHTC
jgi:hypothetical protein